MIEMYLLFVTIGFTFINSAPFFQTSTHGHQSSAPCLLRSANAEPLFVAGSTMKTRANVKCSGTEVVAGTSIILRPRKSVRKHVDTSASLWTASNISNVATASPRIRKAAKRASALTHVR